MNNLLQVGIILTAIDKMSGIINGATDKAGQGFGKLQHKIQQVSASLTEMGTKASVMGHGILTAMETPIKAFADLDEASTNLRVAMMDNLGEVPAQFEAINRQAVELGNVLPGTTADFVNSARALIENGTALDTVVGGGLKAAAYLGVILKIPQTGAAELVAKFRESFGLTENELTKMADLTQRAKFAFGLNPEEVKYAAQYAGSTLNNLKLTGIENTKMFLAMQGIARQKGMEGSVFGTNFASMLNNIGMMEQKLGRNSKIMKAVNSDLKHAGIHLQFFDKAGHFVGLEKMVTELEKLKGLTEQQKLNVMNKVFGMEGGRVASMLSDAGAGGLHKAMETMAKQADLMQRIEETNKSARNTWGALTGTIENFWAAVGEPIVTSLYPLIHAVNDFVGGPLMDWVNENRELVKWLGLGALALGVFLVVLGGLGIVAGAVASGVGGRGGRHRGHALARRHCRGRDCRRRGHHHPALGHDQRVFPGPGAGPRSRAGPAQIHWRPGGRLVCPAHGHGAGSLQFFLAALGGRHWPADRLVRPDARANRAKRDRRPGVRLSCGARFGRGHQICSRPRQGLFRFAGQAV